MGDGCGVSVLGLCPRTAAGIYGGLSSLSTSTILLGSSSLFSPSGVAIRLALLSW